MTQHFFYWYIGIFVVFCFILFYREKLWKWFDSFSQPLKPGKFVKICPNCGSTKIKIPPAGMDIKMTNLNYCTNCKHGQTIGTVFPEVKESEVTEFRMKLKEKWEKKK